MSKSSKNKKSLNANTSLSKIILFIIVFLAITIGIYILCTSVSCNEKNDPYYRCTEYKFVYKGIDSEGTKDVDDDLLVEYEYYKITLNNNHKFTTEYCLKKSSEVHTEKGTYEKTKTTLTLTYDDFTDEPKDVVYTINGDVLSRSELITTESPYYTVKQSFEYFDPKK